MVQHVIQNWLTKHHLSWLAITLAVVGTIIWGLPTDSTANLPLKRSTLPTPELNLTDSITLVESDAKSALQAHQLVVRKNDSLSTLLSSLDVSPQTIYKLTRAQYGKKLAELDVGDALTVWLDEENRLKELHYPKSHTLSYAFTASDKGFKSQKHTKEYEVKTVTAIGEIGHSFYSDGLKAGLSAKSIMNLSDIFSWDIDFIRELRTGDQFKVIYEHLYLDGEYVSDGEILAAEITTNNRRESHNAFLLRNAKGKKVGYYNNKGHNLRKAFLRNPVDYVRITSRFKPKRFHPVLKKWRAHRGVDYGGPTGTPIRATGNGRIVYRGYSRSYGKVIKIRHAGRYLTLYGHMSRFGKFKSGQRVKQGQIIGYIGSTGLATGPHLHYEFRRKGRHVDPLKVKFPSASPVHKKYRADFKQRAKFLMAQMDRLSNDRLLAQYFE